jgi:shikimate kinase
MSLNYITGAPGSGKTAVTNELLARNYSAFDTDDQERTGMSGWHNLETGRYVAAYNELEVTEELLQTHVWRLTTGSLAGFQDRAKFEDIYLCGRLRDSRAVIEASKHVMFLTISGETIATRLAERARRQNEVDWGREQWQVDRSIVVNEELEVEYKKMGAIMIDAGQPIARVVDDIVGGQSN